MKIFSKVFSFLFGLLTFLCFGTTVFAQNNIEVLQKLNPVINNVIEFEKDKNLFEVYGNDKLLGYSFITSSFAEALGFSSAEFKILIFMTADGKINDAILLDHSEPLFLYDKGEIRYEGKGIEEQILYKFIEQYDNKNIERLTINVKNSETNIDGVSSATITSILMHHSIITAANKVSRILGIQGDDKPSLDHDTFEPVLWDDMLNDGSISNALTYISDLDNKNSSSLIDDDVFLDLYFAYANPVGIGQNIFGKTAFLKNFLRSGRDPKERGFFIATKGLFSVLSPRRCLEFSNSIDIKNCKKKGLAKSHFDRMYLEQDGKKFLFRTIDRTNFMFTRNIDDHTPRFFNEIALLFLDKPDEYDPAKNSTLVITYNSASEMADKNIKLLYAPPKRLIIQPKIFDITPATISWIDVWKPQIFNISVLMLFILLVACILLFKDRLVRNRLLYRYIRLSALSFCLIWVGWIAGAQLTIVNIFNYLQLFFVSNFNYTVIVFDPLIVIISLITFISFIILGRGMFCGWLCPFGAMQEIINNISQKIGIKQLKINDLMHRRLIYVKYIILLSMVLLLFIDLDMALIFTEIEPFKTAITLKFIRSWPYVAYAIILLTLSVYISRFYCRYICPLGAALAIGGKIKLFSVLLRRKECGNPCHLCEKSCPTQAIKANGKIDYNECFYCLDCQEEYFDDHRCPPLVNRRKIFMEKNYVN